MGGVGGMLADFATFGWANVDGNRQNGASKAVEGRTLRDSIIGLAGLLRPLKKFVDARSVAPIVEIPHRSGAKS